MNALSQPPFEPWWANDPYYLGHAQFIGIVSKAIIETVEVLFDNMADQWDEQGSDRELPDGAELAAWLYEHVPRPTLTLREDSDAKLTRQFRNFQFAEWHFSIALPDVDPTVQTVHLSRWPLCELVTPIAESETATIEQYVDVLNRLATELWYNQLHAYANESDEDE
jgi:hypothetical protein